MIGPSSSPVDHVFLSKIRLDYWIHAVMFLPWVPLAFFGNLFHSLPATSAFRNALPVIITGIVFAILCQAIQYLLTWRTFNINDLLSNLTGVLLGMVVSGLHRLHFKH